MLTRQSLSDTMTRMLTIRLQRVGKKNEPTFRVVLTESSNGPKSGRFLEILGSYDAREKNVTKVDGDRIKEWISKGAQVSDTVHNLLINQGVIDGEKKNVLPKKTPVVKESEEGAEEGDGSASEGAEAAAPEGDAPAESADAPAEEKSEEETPAAEETPEAPAEEEKPSEEPTKEESTEENKEEEKSE
jgi:small subunit ribosomal protein S16